MKIKPRITRQSPSVPLEGGRGRAMREEHASERKGSRGFFTLSGSPTLTLPLGVGECKLERVCKDVCEGKVGEEATW